MFALSPLVGWVFFVVGIIWTIGFLKAILKTITYSGTNESITKEGMCMQQIYLDCKNQWKVRSRMFVEM